jgi:hypothetical protein
MPPAAEEAPSAQVTDVEFCNCTNDELEAGKTCGLPQCPNHTEED